MCNTRRLLGVFFGSAGTDHCLSVTLTFESIIITIQFVPTVTIIWECCLSVKISPTALSYFWMNQLVPVRIEPSLAIKTQQGIHPQTMHTLVFTVL